MAKTFTLDEAEEKRAAEFQELHRHKGENLGAIGGNISYMFTPTSLGTIAVILCACGHKLVLTDFSAW